jgi:hypothetical protein
MDDGFLIVALACLCGGTVILYERIQIMYLESAILQKNRTALQIAREQMDDLHDQSKWELAYTILLWTSVFAVKWCYFAFFNPFLQAMSNWRNFILYYRFSICFSVVSWLFGVVGQQLVACPYVGKASCESSSKGFSNWRQLMTIYSKMLSRVSPVLFLILRALPILDALADIMGMYPVISGCRILRG